MNPLAYFEIPVRDLDRAMAFYQSVFEADLEKGEIDGYEMAFFPICPGGSGASGALVNGDAYVPTRDGAILYFSVADLGKTLARAASVGAPILYGPKQVSETTRVAEIGDSEGNRIALMEAN